MYGCAARIICSKYVADTLCFELNIFSNIQIDVVVTSIVKSQMLKIEMLHRIILIMELCRIQKLYKVQKVDRALRVTYTKNNPLLRTNI
jgi:hypothetical protein